MHPAKVHIPASLRGPVAAPEIQVGLTYAELPVVLLRALAALEQANQEKAAVILIVDQAGAK